MYASDTDLVIHGSDLAIYIGSVLACSDDATQDLDFRTDRHRAEIGRMQGSADMSPLEKSRFCNSE